MPTTKKKRSFVSTANEALFGTLMTIGDVNDIFPIVKLLLTNKITTMIT